MDSINKEADRVDKHMVSQSYV